MSLLLDALKLEAEQKARDAATEALEQEPLADTDAASEPDLSVDFAALPDSANDTAHDEPSPDERITESNNELPDLSSLELEEALVTLDELQADDNVRTDTEEDTSIFDKLSFEEAPLDDASISNVINDSKEADADTATLTSASATAITQDVPAFTELPADPINAASAPIETTGATDNGNIDENVDNPETSDTEWDDDQEIAFGAAEHIDDTDKPGAEIDLLQQIVQQQNMDCDDILAQLDTRNRQRRQLFMASIACGLVLLAWFFSDIWVAQNNAANSVVTMQPEFPPLAESAAKPETVLRPIDLATEIPMRKILRARPSTRTATGAIAADTNTPRPRLEIRTRNADQSKVQAAHVALRAGNTREAETLYQQALKDNNQSIDALNGIASIALQQQRYDDARDHFLRVLQIAPDNSYAVASLASLVQQGAQKSRLSNLAEQHPDSPAIQYLLGNALAAEQQWLHAQEAYFKAYSKAPQNAQYAFNLAVALDHMGKANAAKQLYGKALTLPNAHLIDKGAVQKRLQQLETP